ncbi:MAG: glycosyltransferase [Pseudomonadota bacterium]
MAADYNQTLLDEAHMLKPDLFFAFKGANVTAQTLRQLKEQGIVTIQFYPDTGFLEHSDQMRGTITEYDWFFSTKSDHVPQLRNELNYTKVSYLPHGFDPETHCPTPVLDRDLADYACEASFVGNISVKKLAMLDALRKAMPKLDLRIWGSPAWGECNLDLANCYQGHPVWGSEYAKVAILSKINLGLLFEGNVDGGADKITARTFEIPSAGGFMLHERTDEVLKHFREDQECTMFSSTEEMIAKIRHFITNEKDRRRIAQAGRQRCLSSGYSTDDRARAVIEKFHELKAELVPSGRKNQG